MSGDEGAVKRQICEYLACRQDVFFWMQESVGTFDPRLGIFLKKNSKFQKNGIPDIILLFKVSTLPPIFVGFEVKYGRNGQSDSQIEFEKDLKSFGGFYFVVRSVDQVKWALKRTEEIIRSKIPRTSAR